MHATPKSTAPVESPLILLVEDDEDIGGAVQDLLESESYRVVTAENGRRGLEQLHRFGPEVGLVLLDVMMPVMTGDEFLEELRAEEGDLARVPVVLLTAVANPSRSTHLANGLFKKPLEIDPFLDLVRQFV